MTETGFDIPPIMIQKRKDFPALPSVYLTPGFLNLYSQNESFLIMVCFLI